MKQKSIFNLMTRVAMMLCVSVLLSSCEFLFGDEDNPVSPSDQGTAPAPTVITLGEIGLAESATLSTAGVTTSHLMAVCDVTVNGEVKHLVSDNLTDDIKQYVTIGWESSDPSKVTVNATTGDATAVAAGSANITVTITDKSNAANKVTKSCAVTVKEGIAYLEWDPTSKTLVSKVLVSGEYNTVANADGMTLSGTKPYVVKADATITGNLTVSANAKLIILNGNTLTVTGVITGGTSRAYSLDICGQAGQTGKLLGNTSNGSTNGIMYFTSLNIHGADISTKGVGNVNSAIYNIANLNVYGGKLTATGGNGNDNNSGHGTSECDAITVYGGELTLTGGSSTGTGAAGNGINMAAENDAHKITVYGGVLTATGGATTGTGAAGRGIYGNIYHASGIQVYHGTAPNPTAGISAGSTTATTTSSRYVVVK